MTIGIKYCGGCNPRYDRVREVMAIEAAYPHFHFAPAADGQCFDYVLVVCGCPSVCAAHKNIAARYKKYILYKPDDYIDISNVLDTLDI